MKSAILFLVLFGLIGSALAEVVFSDKTFEFDIRVRTDLQEVCLSDGRGEFFLKAKDGLYLWDKQNDVERGFATADAVDSLVLLGYSIHMPARIFATQDTLLDDLYRGLFFVQFDRSKKSGLASEVRFSKVENRTPTDYKSRRWFSGNVNLKKPLTTYWKKPLRKITVWVASDLSTIKIEDSLINFKKDFDFKKDDSTSTIEQFVGGYRYFFATTQALINLSNLGTVSTKMQLTKIAYGWRPVKLPELYYLKTALTSVLFVQAVPVEYVNVPPKEINGKMFYCGLVRMPTPEEWEKYATSGNWHDCRIMSR